MIWHESVSLIDLPLLAGELVTPEAKREFGRRFAEIQARVDANPNLGDLRLIYRAASPECFLLCVGKRNFPAQEPYRTARLRLHNHKLPKPPTG